MNIFDNICRSDRHRPSEDETAFAYLNRSSGPQASRVRHLVGQWVDRYPAQHRETIIARFRSAINEHHLGAFFELFLHELILRCGHRVVAIESRVSHTRTSPDFLIENKNGSRFFLDGVLATAHSQPESAAHARLNRALAAIDAIRSPAHFLAVEVTGAATAPLSIWKIKRGLAIWIARLAGVEAMGDTLPFRHVEHGVRIIIRAWPRRDAQESNLSTGVRHLRAMTITRDAEVDTVLKKKISAYGCLDHPYVVAVNAFGNFQLEGNAIDALLGNQPILMGESTKRTRAGKEDGHRRYGIWVGPRGPRNNKLSAVISLESIDPWNFAHRKGRLIHNPWATRAFPPFDLGVGEVNFLGNSFRRTKGRSIARLLGVPQRWPDME